MRISALSKEAVRIPLAAIGVSSATLVGYTVELAVVAIGTTPSSGDWKTGTWSASTDIDYPAGALVIGPSSSSGVTLTAGTTYEGYARVTGGGMTAVVKARDVIEAF